MQSSESLPTFFRNPSDYIALAKDHISNVLNMDITSHYALRATELSGIKLTYRCGDCNTLMGYSNDGRKKHEVEVFFFATASLALDRFDEKTMDLCSRIEREFLDNSLNHPDIVESPDFIQSDPLAFDPDNGYFCRQVCIRQIISMGPVEETYLEIEGTELDGSTQANSSAAEAG